MRINIKPENCKFHIDEKNRKVVCVLEDTEWKFENFLEDNDNGHLFNWYPKDVKIPNRFIGIASCSAEDPWDEKFGRRLAFTRAKRAFYKAFFAAADSYIDQINNKFNNLIEDLNAFGERISLNLDKDSKYIDEYLKNFEDKK